MCDVLFLVEAHATCSLTGRPCVTCDPHEVLSMETLLDGRFRDLLDRTPRLLLIVTTIELNRYAASNKAIELSRQVCYQKQDNYKR